MGEKEQNRNSFACIRKGYGLPFPVLSFPSSREHEKERQNNKVGWSHREKVTEKQKFFCLLSSHIKPTTLLKWWLFIVCRWNQRLAHSKDRFRQKISIIQFWRVYRECLSTLMSHQKVLIQGEYSWPLLKTQIQ